MNMKRIIKNYENVEQRHLDLIGEMYPEGFSDEDLQLVNLANGQTMTCLEIRTEGCIYLFRIDRAMLEVLEETMDDSFDLGDVDEEALDKDDD